MKPSPLLGVVLLLAQGGEGPWLEKARALFERGRIDEALDSLDRLKGGARETSEFLDLFSRLCLAKAEAGGAYASVHLEDAARALRALLEKEPGRPEPAALLVRALLGLGDVEGAREALVRAEAWAPASTLLARARGELALAEGDAEGAAREWAQALGADPPAVDPAFLARRLAPETALRLLDEAVARRETKASGALWWWIGRLRYGRREWRPAREAFDRAHAVDPSLLDALLFAGRAAWEAGERREAEGRFLALAAAAGERLSTLVRTAEGDERPLARVLFLAADAAFREGRLAEARDLFGAMVALDPSDPAAWNNRAFLCRQTGLYEDAWRAYLGGIRLRRDDARLLNDAALIMHYHLGDDPHLARAIYERAIECTEVLLLDPRASGTARREALAAKKDAEENLRRLLEGRRGPDPIEVAPVKLPGRGGIEQAPNR